MKTWGEINKRKNRITIENINKGKSCFFENINNIDKTLAKLRQKKKDLNY